MPNCRRRGSNPGRGVRSPSFNRIFMVDLAKLQAAGFEPRSRGSKCKIAGGGVRTQVAGFEFQVLIDFSWVYSANCRRRGSSPGRGDRNPSFNQFSLGRFCHIAGGGVRTQVAGFEVQVLIDVSWVDFAKLLAAGFEPRSRGSKSKC